MLQLLSRNRRSYTKQLSMAHLSELDPVLGFSQIALEGQAHSSAATLLLTNVLLRPPYEHRDATPGIASREIPRALSWCFARSPRLFIATASGDYRNNDESYDRTEVVGALLAVKRTIPTLYPKIMLFAVKSEWRKRGVGSSLLNYSEEVLRRQGVSRLTLDPLRETREFYAKRGYQAVGDPNSADYKMRKTLV